MQTTVRSEKDAPPVQPVFVRYAELKSHGVPFSRQHIDSLEREGKFPKRVKLSPGVAVWRLSSVLDWLAERAEA